MVLRPWETKRNILKLKLNSVLTDMDTGQVMVTYGQQHACH